MNGDIRAINPFSRFFSTADYDGKDKRLTALKNLDWGAFYQRDFERLLFPQFLLLANEWKDNRDKTEVQLLVEMMLIADRTANGYENTHNRAGESYNGLMKKVDALIPEILQVLFEGNNWAANEALELYRKKGSDAYQKPLQEEFEDEVGEMERVFRFTGSKDFYANFIDFAKKIKEGTEKEFLDQYKEDERPAIRSVVYSSAGVGNVGFGIARKINDYFKGQLKTVQDDEMRSDFFGAKTEIYAVLFRKDPNYKEIQEYLKR